MKIKKIITVLVIIVFVSLVFLMQFMEILDISNVHELDGISFAEGSFEEVVLNNFIEQSEGDEFNRILVYPYGDRNDDRELRSQEPEVIKDVLTKLNNMDLESYGKEIFENIFNISDPPNGMRKKRYDLMYDNSYVIRFYIPGTSEDLSIYINGSDDNSDYILVEKEILNIWEEKEKKIIHYETDRSYSIYKVVENKVEMDYIEMLLDTSNK